MEKDGDREHYDLHIVVEHVQLEADVAVQEEPAHVSLVQEGRMTNI